MTTAQKISIRLSELRQRLNELSGKETLEAAEAAEIETLRSEFTEKEVQFRAALAVEGEEENAALGLFGDGDGEAAETRALLRDSPLSGYMTTASAGLGLSGAPAELNAALKVSIVGPSGGVLIPWAVLENRQALMRRAGAEARAFTDTGNLEGGVMQRPILQRLFGPGIMDALGVRIESVPAGVSEFPLLTGGAVPVQKAEGAVANAAAEATFTTETLKPKKLTGKYEFTHEQSAQIPGIEAALRRDLGDAVRAKMSDLVMNGDEATNDHEPDGFLTTLMAPGAPGSESGFSDYAGAAAAAVDGIHAVSEDQVAVVVGIDSYRHAASVYQAGSGESGSEALKRRSQTFMASSYVPAKAGTVQNGNIIHAAGPNGGRR